MTNSVAPSPRPGKPHPAYLPYFGRTIAVNVDKPGEDDFDTVSGKVQAVGPDSIAIAWRSVVRIVMIKDIIGEVEIQSPITRSKVQIRKLRNPGEVVRNHLAGRHGMSLKILNAINEPTAKIVHDKIDHSGLGHVHTDEVDTKDGSQPKRLRQSAIDDSDRPLRQHLADRHGQVPAVLNGIQDAMLRLMHDAINHSDLSHRHEVFK